MFPSRPRFQHCRLMEHRTEIRPYYSEVRDFPMDDSALVDEKHQRVVRCSLPHIKSQNLTTVLNLARCLNSATHTSKLHHSSVVAEKPELLQPYKDLQLTLLPFTNTHGHTLPWYFPKWTSGFIHVSFFFFTKTSSLLSHEYDRRLRSSILPL
jgi:hypothetical protein